MMDDLMKRRKEERGMIALFSFSYFILEEEGVLLHYYYII